MFLPTIYLQQYISVQPHNPILKLEHEEFSDVAVIPSSYDSMICIQTWIFQVNQVSQGQTLNPYPTAFPYGNGMVLHFYQQQESSTTKTVHKVINKGLKTYV